jgi:hypothetical protein
MDLRSITIMAGGQTGADRAALDFAIEHGMRHGGWCPRGRLAEDGPIPARYQLQETASRKYSQRNEWNVRDSDATVLFSIGPQVYGGSRLTLAIARRLAKPYLHLVRDGEASIAELAEGLREFLDAHHVERLNVAGPRASQEAEIGPFVRDVLREVLAG